MLEERRQLVINHLENVENLIFQGGGVKGVAYLGVLDILLDDKSVSKIKLSQIKRVAGASAGAITALPLALGKNYTQLHQLMRGVNLKEDLLDEEKRPFIHKWETRDTVLRLIEFFNSDIDLASLIVYYIWIARAELNDLGLTPQQIKLNISPIIDMFVSLKDTFSAFLAGLVESVIDRVVPIFLNKTTKIDVYIVQEQLLQKFGGNKRNLDAFDKDVINLLKRFLERGYIFSGEKFHRWIESQLSEVKGSSKDITFEELHGLKKNNNAIKDLYVVALDVGTGVTKIFSHEHTPPVCVADGVYASMAIPYFFASREVRCKKMREESFVFGRRLYDLEPYREGEEVFSRVYADGGVLDNYPAWLFDNTRYSSLFFHQSHKNSYNEKTLGIRLVSESEKNFFEKKVESPSITFESKNLLNYSTALVSAVMHKQDNDHHHGRGRRRTIYVDTKGISFVDFGISDANKDVLIESGCVGAIDYLKRALKREQKEYNYSFQKTLRESAKVGGMTFLGITLGFLCFMKKDTENHVGISLGLGISLGVAAGIGELLSRTITNSRLTLFSKKITEEERASKIVPRTAIFSGLFLGTMSGLLTGKGGFDAKAALYMGVLGVISGGCFSYLNCNDSSRSSRIELI